MSKNEKKEILRAAKKGDLKTVQVLVEQDKSLLDVRDKDGSTPLHCASWKGHVAVVEFLIDAGADINDHNENSHWGTTPLHAAAHGNQKSVAKVLIDKGADLHARNLNDQTPLGETTVHNAKAVAKLLEDAGAPAE